MIALHCPKCGERVEISENMGGQSLPCPGCSQWILIPKPLNPISASPLPGYSAGVRTNGKAIAALVLGLCAFCVGICGVVAIILGALAKRDIDRSGGAQKGETMAIMGIVLGALGFAVNLSLAIYQLSNQ